MKELTLEAKIENGISLLNFVNEQLDACGCPKKIRAVIDVAVDELFSNIAYYAYKGKTGNATVRMEIKQDPLAAELTFIDQGIPFDPLAKADPDTTLKISERPIGGMGIYIVKNSMDDVRYEYRDGHNVLTIRKLLRDNQ